MVACVYKTLVSSYNLVSIIFTEGLLFSFEILYSSLCSYKELQNLNNIYRIVNSLNSLLHASLQPKFNFFSQLSEEITLNPQLNSGGFFTLIFNENNHLIMFLAEGVYWIERTRIIQYMIYIYNI